MSLSFLQIELPPDFDANYEPAVIDYLSDRLVGRAAWAQAFDAFDLLDQAVVVTESGRTTFRALYRQLVDQEFADEYIEALLALEDVKRGSPELWAQFARQIAQEATQRRWKR